MDRKIFKLPFNKKGVSKYQCPSCEKGLLEVKIDTFHNHAIKSSRYNYEDLEWDPELTVYIYSCLFECVIPDCKAVVSSSGKGYVEEVHYNNEVGKPVSDYIEYFVPEFFIPNLRMFKIPNKTPEDVQEEINKSFSLIFSDPSSSANHIRVALENLLTYLNVKRFTISKNKRYFLSLHNRIGLIPKKYQHIGNIFTAVKWLGNAGSHSNNKVTLDDVLDSYELIIELLVEIFSNNRLKVKLLAKEINKKKGPK